MQNGAHVVIRALCGKFSVRKHTKHMPASQTETELSFMSSCTCANKLYKQLYRGTFYA